MSQVEPSQRPSLNSGRAQAITADEAGGGGVPPSENLPSPPKVSRQGTSSLTASPTSTDALETSANQDQKASSGAAAGPALSLSGTNAGSRQQPPSHRTNKSTTTTTKLPTTAPSSMASSRSSIDDDSPRSTAVESWTKDRQQQLTSDAPSVPNIDQSQDSAATTEDGAGQQRQQQQSSQRHRSFSEDDQHRLVMQQQQQQQQQQQMMQQQGPSPSTTPDRRAAEQQHAQNPDDQAAGVPAQAGHRRHHSHRTHRKHKHKHKSHRSHRSADASDPIADAQLPPGYGHRHGQHHYPHQEYYPQQRGIPGQYSQQYIGQPPHPPPGMVYQADAPPPGTPVRRSTDDHADYVTPPPKSSGRRSRGRLQKSLSAPTGRGGNLFGTPPGGAAAPSGYGAVDSHTFPGPPTHAAPHYGGGGTGGPVPPSTTNFSPRKELLALSGISSSSRGRMQAPPASPGGGGQQQGMMPPSFGGSPPRGWSSPQGAVSPAGQQQPPFQAVPRHIGNRARASSYGSERGGAPPVARLSPLRESRPMTADDLQLHLIPTTPLLHGGDGPTTPATASDGRHQHHRGVYTVPHDEEHTPGGGDGEADAFLPQNISRGGGGSGRKGSHPHHRSTSSVRKMHMRQQSVELFMDHIKGTEQPKALRDVLFAILFYAQVAAMLYVGIRYGKDAVRAGALGGGDDDGADEEEKTEDIFVTYHNVIIVACLCGAFAVTTSALALFVMMAIARRLIQVALVFCVGMAFAWGTIGIGLSPKSFVPITGIIALALSIGYTFVVWDRIPFAASNLHSALSGIRANLGVVGVAFCFQALTLAVSIYYTFAVIGLYDAIKFGDVNLSGAPKILAFIGVGLAYYWTYQVIVHVVQVTVAGIIGSWWFKPDSSPPPCSKALRTSFVRSTLLSFGSVCFGSLLVGFVQALRQIAEPIRPNRDESVLMCLHECLVCFQECIVSCVDTLADSFTPWAFTYVGLYGYGFLDAGHKATELFRKRGWTKIVTDDLITNVLFMVSLVIGGVTGCFALLIEALDDFKFVAVEESTMAAFLIGLAVGIVLSSVLFSMISSSVNVVIVCFAGSPVEFQQNHAELSDEMRHAWREVWPGCMDIIDLKISMGV